MLQSTLPNTATNRSSQQRIRSGSIAIQEDSSINLREKYITVNPIYAYTEANIKLILDAYLFKRNLAQQPVTGIILNSNSALKTANGSTFSFGEFESIQINIEPNDSQNFKHLSNMIGKLIELNHHGFFEIVSKHVVLAPFSIKDQHVALAVISFELEKESDRFYLGSNLNIEIDDPTQVQDNYLIMLKEQIFNSLLKHTKQSDVKDEHSFKVNIVPTSCKKLNHYRDCGVVVVSRIVEFLDHLELSQEFKPNEYSVGDLYQLRNRHLVTAPAFVLQQQAGMPSPETIAKLISSQSLSTIADLDSKGHAVFTKNETGNIFDGLVLNSLAVATGHELVNGSEYTGQFKEGRRIGMGLEKNSEQASGFGVCTSFNGFRDTESAYKTGEICAIVDIDTTSIDIRKIELIDHEKGFKIFYKGNIKNGVIDGAGTVSIVGYKSLDETQQLNNQIICVDICTSKFADGKILLDHLPRVSAQGGRIVNLLLPDEIDNFKHKFLLHASPDFYEQAFNTRNELVQPQLVRSHANSLEASSVELPPSHTLGDREFKRTRIADIHQMETPLQDTYASFLPLLGLHVAAKSSEQVATVSAAPGAVLAPISPRNESLSM